MFHGTTILCVRRGSHVVLGGDGVIASVDAQNNNTVNWETSTDGKVADLSFAKSGQWVVVATGLPGVSGKALVIDSATGKVTRAGTSISAIC